MPRWWPGGMVGSRCSLIVHDTGEAPEKALTSQGQDFHANFTGKPKTWEILLLISRIIY